MEVWCECSPVLGGLLSSSGAGLRGPEDVRTLLAVPLTSLTGQPQKPWAVCQALFLAHALHLSLGLLIIVLKAAEKTEAMGNGSQTHGKGV